MPPKKKARTKKEKKSASSSSSSKVPIKTGPTWNDVFLNSVVFDNLCTFLNPRDLFALRATTKQLSDSFDTLFKTQWNINRSLGRFSRDPVQFRSMMAKCDALISGSFALQFFARTVWMDSDLDIYIESYPEVKIKTFGEYLAAEEGYALDNTKGIHDYSDHNKNVVKVHTYARAETSGHISKIQIISTCTPPLDAILTSFYTTALVNVISWKSAYSVYPDLTFRDMKTYQLVGLDEYHKPLLEKYSRRGWTTLEMLSKEDEKKVSSLWCYIRRLGDRWTWKFPLDTKDITPGLSDSVMEFSTFHVTKDSGLPWEEQREHYKVSLAEFKSCVLRHTYFFARWLQDRNFWYWIGPKLEALSLQQLSSLENIPESVDMEDWLFVNAEEIHANTPEGWIYYDDQLPKWYAEWQETQKKKKQAKKSVQGKKGLKAK